MSSSIWKLVPDQDESRCAQTSEPNATMVRLAARMSRELVKRIAAATSHTTANWGRAIQARTWPVSTARYLWMVPRKPGIRMLLARCTKLQTKIDKARMTRFLEFRKERSTSGFGCSILLTQVAANKKSPAAVMAMITGEWNQSRRSP